MNEYREINPIDRSQAQAILCGNELDQIRLTLVRIAFHEQDYEWAISQCLSFCNHHDDEVRGVAVTCLGHVARVHGKMDMARVGPVLERLLLDPAVAGRVEDAMSDIKRFA